MDHVPDETQGTQSVTGGLPWDPLWDTGDPEEVTTDMTETEDKE